MKRWLLCATPDDSADSRWQDIAEEFDDSAYASSHGRWLQTKTEGKYWWLVVDTQLGTVVNARGRYR